MAEVRIVTDQIEVQTNGMTDILDLTPRVRERLMKSGMCEGNVTIFVPGATAGVSTIEYEPGLLKDLPEMFEQIAPYEHDYHHHKTWGDYNGSSHCRAPLIGPSLVVPFIAGDMILGTWQQIVLFDFDDRPRKRKVVCQFIGA
ncbi:secondary thiamine-phosphate synthase enzyme YjbQ [bacterium]|nr:secondary thiamine-phosphate synthase enzyme YjbQ [bacterium]